MKHALYDWWGLNVALFAQINGVRWPPLDNFLAIMSALGHPGLYPLYLAAALWRAWRRPIAGATRNVLTLAIAYPLVSMIVVPALKRALDWPRPITVLGADAVNGAGLSDTAHSFPSGHAAFAVLLAASLMPGSSLVARLSLGAFAALVCLSRISLGAHFPADVVAGALLSLAIVAMVRLALPRGARE